MMVPNGRRTAAIGRVDKHSAERGLADWAAASYNRRSRKDAYNGANAKTPAAGGRPSVTRSHLGGSFMSTTMFAALLALAPGQGVPYSPPAVHNPPPPF